MNGDSMEEYDIKKTNQDKFKGDGLKDMIASLFPNYTIENERYVVRFGAMQPMIVWQSGKKLCVDITTDKNVDNETALKTISLRNIFLETTTGYTAKERLKRLKKSEG